MTTQTIGYLYVAMICGIIILMIMTGSVIEYFCGDGDDLKKRNDNIFR